MTLIDFCRLLKQYLTWVIAVPIACFFVVAVVVAVALPAEYSATAMLRSSAAVDIGSLGGATASAVQDVATQSNMEVSSSSNTSLRSVYITAEGTNAEGVLQALQDVATKTEENIKALFGDSATVVVSVPSTAEDSSPSPLTYGLVGLLVGLFGIICVIVVLDRLKDPVHSAEEVEDLYDIACLGVCVKPEDSLPSSRDSSAEGAADKKIKTTKGAHGHGHARSNASSAFMASWQPNSNLARETLLANVTFAAGNASSFSLVPVSSTDNATLVAKALAYTAQKEHVEAEFRRTQPSGRNFASFISDTESQNKLAFLITCSVEEGVSASYASNEAEASVLVLEPMKTSHRALKETLHQLNIAKANIIGFVCAPQEHNPR